MSVLDDPTGLDAVADGLRAGHSLPARWYADPELLAREQELIFRRSWQYAGRADQVAEPGALPMRRRRAGAARDRARPRRRAARARQRLPPPRPPGARRRRDAARRCSAPTTRGPTTSTARCARSRAATASRGSTRRARPAARERRDLGAVPVRASRPGRAGRSPTRSASCRRCSPDCGVDLERLAFRRRVPWTLAANWKVAVENYLECYHCPVAHPGLAKAIDVGADALRARGAPELLRPARRRARRPRRAGCTRARSTARSTTGCGRT